MFVWKGSESRGGKEGSVFGGVSMNLRRWCPSFMICLSLEILKKKNISTFNFITQMTYFFRAFLFLFYGVQVLSINPTQCWVSQWHVNRILSIEIWSFFPLNSTGWGGHTISRLIHFSLQWATTMRVRRKLDGSRVWPSLFLWQLLFLSQHLMTTQKRNSFGDYKAVSRASTNLLLFEEVKFSR